jgi:hypothetical protein
MSIRSKLQKVNNENKNFDILHCDRHSNVQMYVDLFLTLIYFTFNGAILQWDYFRSSLNSSIHDYNNMRRGVTVFPLAELDTNDEIEITLKGMAMLSYVELTMTHLILSLVWTSIFLANF